MRYLQRCLGPLGCSGTKRIMHEKIVNHKNHKMTIFQPSIGEEPCLLTSVCLFSYVNFLLLIFVTLSSIEHIVMRNEIHCMDLLINALYG